MPQLSRECLPVRVIFLPFVSRCFRDDKTSRCLYVSYLNYIDPPDTVKARLQVQRRASVYLGTVDAFGKVGARAKLVRLIEITKMESFLNAVSTVYSFFRLRNKRAFMASTEGLALCFSLLFQQTCFTFRTWHLFYISGVKRIFLSIS